MADWTHRYRKEGIPPPGSIGGTITAHTPGKKIADAVTEIQDRVVADLNLDLEGITDNGSNIENNTLNLRFNNDAVTQVQTSLEGIEDTGTNIAENLLTISLRTEPPEGVTQTVYAVAGGAWPEFTVQELEVENGLIKNVGDGQQLYPEFETFTGEKIYVSSVAIEGDALVFTRRKTTITDGLVVSDETNDTISIPLVSCP